VVHVTALCTARDDSSMQAHNALRRFMVPRLQQWPCKRQCQTSNQQSDMSLAHHCDWGNRAGFHPGDQSAAGASDGCGHARQLRTLSSDIHSRQWHVHPAGAKAITYNTALVPVEAGILASIEPAGGWDRSQTVATLTVTGLLRNRG
jgi:hypothetical protein